MARSLATSISSVTIGHWLGARRTPTWYHVLGDVVAYINLLDRRVLDSGSGPGHALSRSGDLFPNRMDGFEGLCPEAR